MMLTLDASRSAIFRRVEFPAALPLIFSGTRDRRDLRGDRRGLRRVGRLGLGPRLPDAPGARAGSTPRSSSRTSCSSPPIALALFLLVVAPRAAHDSVGARSGSRHEVTRAPLSTDLNRRKGDCDENTTARPTIVLLLALLAERRSRSRPAAGATRTAPADDRGAARPPTEEARRRRRKRRATTGRGAAPARAREPQDRARLVPEPRPRRALLRAGQRVSTTSRA